MPNIDWLHRIEERFGKNYKYLTLSYVPISEEGYSLLERETSKEQEEYDIYINQYTFRLSIPEDVLRGIALATYAAKLPIRVVEVKGDEIDLNMLAQEKVYLSSDDITPETIEDYTWDLMGVTCILKTWQEEILITGQTAFTIYGFRTAFDWIKRRFKDEAPSPEKYIKGLYYSDDSEFNPISLYDCLGYE